ncbi:flagellar hook protein FlgE [Alcaligenes faecalis]|jgi:flagellar hook protein FlgE|uniref:Flagellar hook protein FlgE n=1 Tax=Alcaligenes faecalis TaxID=511 RepID=A0A0M7FZF9_ALCFA|nr:MULTISPECIES: flagellar hook protein FlgE [Alcaligenes]ALO39546.1 flagellar biosynthesis protein FlgE [Alcaligenes faecalis]ATH99092.1 flagellar hook protein FlgE [Alcaligenes faecalis]AYZ91879.1 flagellar hook protein FlgE [Alcaligenes faecalis]KAA1284397.1 flagellar hook protein FlgE [Alcaligenes faecalis]MBH0312435.1 flagellar hook protein FlgE [Alcaligenes faecalis]
MSFGQGLSGLNAASQNLDSIGNNIANSGTVGYKASTVQFADVYANSRVGLGVQVSRVSQRFSVGNVSNSGNQFDMAIDGENGLFRLEQSNGAVLFSRNGQFYPDKAGYLINAQGHYLTGYGVGSSELQRLQVPSANVPPKATTALDFKPNLPGGAEAIPTEDANGNLINVFDPKDPTTYSESFSYSVYDSLGNSHEISQYFVKRPANAAGESVWDVYYMEGSTPLSPASATMTFNGSGVMTSPNPATVNVTLANPGGNASPADDLVFDIRYNGTTQFGGEFAKGKPYQDGYATGEYASMSIDKDGTMVAAYTNGVTQRLGSLVLADFSNLQGLRPVGGNAWAETGESGQPILGRPGENGLASIKGQAVEDSNVDMGQELVNMIIAQRTYQANAQTIKTQDQVLQTLVNLR